MNDIMDYKSIINCYGDYVKAKEKYESLENNQPSFNPPDSITCEEDYIYWTDKQSEYDTAYTNWQVDQRHAAYDLKRAVNILSSSLPFYNTWFVIDYNNSRIAIARSGSYSLGSEDGLLITEWFPELPSFQDYQQHLYDEWQKKNDPESKLEYVDDFEDC